MTLETVRRGALVVFLLFAVALVPSQGFAQQPAGSAPAAAPAANAPSVTPPADAATTASGLATKVITAGSGSEKPGTDDTVRFSFVGYKQDGTSFSSPPNYTARVGTIAVPGLAEGLRMMVVGEKRRMWMPEKLAFKGAAGKPAGPIVFDVELSSIVPMPKAPPDVAAAPANAEKTKSGLASLVVKPGTGTVHPTNGSNVTVHYTGWTTDGKMFDSSVVRGRPSTFQLEQVIAGWTEGVQLMVVGETRRFWIPEKLAYKGQDPKGLLVFDIELLAIDGKQ
jgi:FKBP-type peptidyl-prolyl cis-trans isomerase